MPLTLMKSAHSHLIRSSGLQVFRPLWALTPVRFKGVQVLPFMPSFELYSRNSLQASYTD